MNFTCYVIDDEADSVALMTEYIEQTPGLQLLGSATNPLDALDILTGKDAPDITFVDVDMRQLSGMELAGMVNLYTAIVFTTAFPEYALPAFDKEAFDFLLKPINYERFLKCIHKARRKITKRTDGHPLLKDDFFNIKSEIKGRIIKILFEQVIYIEGASNYIQIITTEGKHITYLTMREIERHLPGNLFVRIHRSFIININFVSVTERSQVKLKTGESLNMGDHYKQRFLALMDEHLIKSDRNT